jgi:uncharacterized protein YaeQ
MWIDLGEPSPDRIKKASRIAKEVKVYSFNRKSSHWQMSESIPGQLNWECCSVE